MEESSNPSSIVSQPNESVVLGGYVQNPQMEEHTDPSSMISQPSEISALKQVIESTLECSLCLSMICEPISISCGHSFCRTCLVKSLRRHKKKCPSCRAICHVMAETAEVFKSLCGSYFKSYWSVTFLTGKYYNQRGRYDNKSWWILGEVGGMYGRTLVMGKGLSDILLQRR